MTDSDSYVAVVNVRDDFFNDPFFKDWWSDFEGPVSVLDGPGEWIFILMSKKNNEQKQKQKHDVYKVPIISFILFMCFTNTAACHTYYVSLS